MRSCPIVQQRLMAVLVVLVVLVVATSCNESEPEISSDTTTTIRSANATTATTRPGQRSAPRWETITTFTGTGSERTEQFSILPEAIQWRARWNCEHGRLVVTTIPVPRRPRPLVDSACQGIENDKAMGYSIITGPVQMAVDAGGPWEITVDQQVDTPLLETPLPGMDTAKVLSQGNFYDMEKAGKGTARIYQLADGNRALRFDDFEVTNDIDLFVWLSEASAPKTSAAAQAADHLVLGNLKSTLGNQNYLLPADLDLDRFRSIVIWCAPERTAYAGAALTQPVSQ